MAIRTGLVLCLLSFAPIAEFVAAQTTAPLGIPARIAHRIPYSVRGPLERAYDAAAKRPEDAKSVGNLAELLHAYEQYGIAADYYEAAHQLEPHEFRWSYLLGVVQSELGADAKATVSFRRSLQADPSYLAARLRLADALLRAGDPASSHAEYQALVRQFPELALAHYELGRARATLGDTQGAIDHYRRATTLAPQFGRAHYALALSYRNAGSLALAQTHLDAYRRHGSRRPQPPDPLVEEVRSLAGTARELITEAARRGNAGHVQDSITLHLKALRTDPTASRAHVNLIALYGRSGQSALAEEQYRAALALRTDVAEAHYNYGVLQASAGRLPEAMVAFRAALDVDPFNAAAHNNLGAVLVRLNRRADALLHYRQALAIDPQHRSARFGMGGVLLTMGRVREAIEHFERSLVPEGAETPRYGYALAQAWMAAGDSDQARRCASDALTLARRLGQGKLAATIEAGLLKMRTPGK